MSLIEDLSNPLSRLIVYLCLSLIGLKRELSPWSIQRREKSNHFSLRLSFFVHLFLSSSFSSRPCSLIPSLSPPPSLCLSHTFGASPQISSHVFVPSLSYSSIPNWSPFLTLSSSPIFPSIPCPALHFFWAPYSLYLLYTSDQLQQAIHQVSNS